jgi:hypothetical protein
MSGSGDLLWLAKSRRQGIVEGKWGLIAGGLMAALSRRHARIKKSARHCGQGFSTEQE